MYVCGKSIRTILHRRVKGNDGRGWNINELEEKFQAFTLMLRDGIRGYGKH